MTFSIKKLAGLPAIAAAAFFMQALDATILNTATVLRWRCSLP